MLTSCIFENLPQLELSFMILDKEKLYRLYTELHSELKFFISRYINNQDDINDILNDTFVHAYEQILKKNVYDVNLRAWLYTIAKNCALNFCKKQKTRLNYIKNAQPADTQNFEDQLIDAMYLQKIIDFVLKNFSDREIEIFGLRIYDNFTIQEIAQITKISKSGVDRIIKKMLKRIKNKFTPESDG